jgi:hypothetical protein
MLRDKPARGQLHKCNSSTEVQHEAYKEYQSKHAKQSEAGCLHSRIGNKGKSPFEMGDYSLLREEKKGDLVLKRS